FLQDKCTCDFGKDLDDVAHLIECYRQDEIDIWSDLQLAAMAPIERETLRPIVYYEFLQGHSALHSICAAFNGNVVHYSTVSRWLKRFESGDTTFGDRPRSGRPSSVDDEALRNALNAKPNATTRESVNLESTRKVPFKEAAEIYLQRHYPNAGKGHCSVPSCFLLEDPITEALVNKRKREEDVQDVAVYNVFQQVKDLCGSAASLALANYKFSFLDRESLYEQAYDKWLSKDTRKEDFLEPMELQHRSHCISLCYPSKDAVYNVFFQIKRTNEKDSTYTFKRHFQDAILQCRLDRLLFRTMCGPVLDSEVKVIAFPSFPNIKREELGILMNCKMCPRRIITKEDIQGSQNLGHFLFNNEVIHLPDRNGEGDVRFEKLFSKVLSIYICAPITFTMAWTPSRDFKAPEDQKIWSLFTPDQEKLVNDQTSSSPLLINGGPGTGKTIVVKKRAERLAEEALAKVLVINLAGGCLTENLRRELQGKRNIMVVDGREKGISKNLGRLLNFLKENGKNKHVLIDEVPLTFGMEVPHNPAIIAAHWEPVLNDISTYVESLTIAFRPNDPSYIRSIDAQSIQIPNVQMTCLNVEEKHVDLLEVPNEDVNSILNDFDDDTLHRLNVVGNFLKVLSELQRLSERQRSSSTDEKSKRRLVLQCLLTSGSRGNPESCPRPVAATKSLVESCSTQMGASLK
ncbi:unnamed protein product, partial [Darwinula stevensoni]